jgi:hypothetical protein
MRGNERAVKVKFFLTKELPFLLSRRMKIDETHRVNRRSTLKESMAS